MIFLPALAPGAELEYPPKLPGSKNVVTDTSMEFIKKTETIKLGVAIAKTPATIDFLYYPEQTYPGNPWSVWGDSLAVGDKYYSAIGDHRAPQGNAFLYEYDSKSKKMRTLVNVQNFLNMPDGHYVPGKIHTRIDIGRDGWRALWLDWDRFLEQLHRADHTRDEPKRQPLILSWKFPIWVACPRRRGPLAEGLCHRSLGQRPRI